MSQISSSSQPEASPHKQHMPTLPSLWLVLTATVLLLTVVISISLFSSRRNEAQMARLLASKGEALIWAVESSLRMGFHAAIRLQTTLQQMVGPDVLFIAITMPDGTILAHNIPERLGETLDIEEHDMSAQRLRALSHGLENSEARWLITHMENARSFVVYRHFMPSVLQGNDATHGRGRRENEQHFNPLPSMRSSQGHDVQAMDVQPLIFMGLNLGPFEEGQRQDKERLFGFAGSSIIVAIATLFIFYYAQRAQESRRRQYVAEGQVRELEKEVQRKEKMAAIGNLAAGVAHEIRNPLSSIKGYATYFGQRFPKDSEDRKAASVMVREVERLNRVITDLIGLSRPTDIHAVPTDMLLVIEHALRLLRQDAEKNGVYLHFTPPTPAIAPIPLDIDRFGQALLNVCLNAIESMPPQGGHVFLRLFQEGKKRVCLEVRDTGTGIADKDIPHIFDPYFTTKGQGTGLGLATVHKIVEAHGGEISLTSHHATHSQNSGTVFHIFLPMTAV